MTTDFLRTALIYDFDGTLAKGNLQEQTFIPEIGMSREEFWSEVKRRTKDSDADEILVYMHLMLEKARESNSPVTKEALQSHGHKAPLFKGLDGCDWFHRINGHAAERGLKLDHYIISSGIHEMIEGCSIRQAFTNIFASKFIYNEKGEASCRPEIVLRRDARYDVVDRDACIGAFLLRPSS
jgi:hypothetical protein